MLPIIFDFEQLKVILKFIDGHFFHIEAISAINFHVLKSNLEQIYEGKTLKS